MTHIVYQCIAAGLVDPNVHTGVDGAQVRANASIHSMEEIKLTPVQTIEDYITDLEQNDSQSPGTSPKDDNDKDDDNDHHNPDPQPNETHRSTIDPEARLYKKSSLKNESEKPC